MDVDRRTSSRFDGLSHIRLVVGVQTSTQLCHIEIHNLWARQEHAPWIFRARVPTAEMPTDGLTKALSRQKHEHFVRLLNLQDTGHLIEQGGAATEVLEDLEDED